MKIDIKIEFDTDNEKDLQKIEEVLGQLQQVQEILKKLDNNLNKRYNTNNNKQ
jgi:hypothetical protein